MIVGPHPDGYVVIRQMDHGAMAAQMSRGWGNERVGDLASRAAVEDAHRLHDSGWDRLDDEPTLHGASGRPAGFREVALADRLAAQRAGIDVCIAHDPYVGLLASMHFSSTVARPRWAKALGADGRRVRRYLTDAAQRHRRLRDLIDVDDAELTRGWRLTRAIDGLSIDVLTGGPVRPRSVPAADGTVALRVVPAGSDTFAVDPWPWAADRLELEVPRRILTERYSDERALRDALDAAPVVAGLYRLVAA